jgi:ubiquinone/menaquinone biosynthesis C-methylase UbiE
MEAYYSGKAAAVEQYRDPSNLSARAQIYRFGTSARGWSDWICDQLEIQDGDRVLELGAGPGRLWAEIGDRIGKCSVIVSDKSHGMAQAARERLTQVEQCRFFLRCGAQHIPLSDETADVVIANHMLYHVPDRPAAFAEVRRVLRSGGRFYAATNGRNHLRELHDLMAIHNPKWTKRVFSVTEFELETGGEQLARWFNPVVVRRQGDVLAVTESTAVIEYVRSIPRVRSEMSEAQLDSLAADIETRIKRDGAFRIKKDSGLFIARRE